VITTEIHVLDKTHDRKSFSCGEKSLDQYFQQFATQDIKRNISRIFVATEKKRKTIVVFYSLSANSIDASDLPLNLRKKLPKYPVPISLLGRLAVSQDVQHQGMGKVLLADALQRVYHASKAMAVYAVIVEALDENAKKFYQKFGFLDLPNKPLTLFLPLQTIKKLINC